MPSACVAAPVQHPAGTKVGLSQILLAYHGWHTISSGDHRRNWGKGHNMTAGEALELVRLHKPLRALSKPLLKTLGFDRKCLRF